MTDPKLILLAEELIKSIQSNNLKGFDPYDLKGLSWIRTVTKWGNQIYPMAIVREIVFELIYAYPLFFRKLFGIKHKLNPKALGLIATSANEFFEATNLNKFLKLRDQCFELLLKDKNPDGPLCWGYPFDWQSSQLIPAHTPNGIVTTAVGEAFWTRYKISGNEHALSTCVQIARFLDSLPIDHISSGQLCFSYVPHYQNHVHNLNLFVADFLIKVGLEVDNKEWVNLGNCAVNYTIANQRDDGSFDYNGPPEKPQNFVDNYHTGFVLRMLGSCYHYTKREDVKSALDKGLTYYIENFFAGEGIPKFKPDRTYRIDIHSSAEAINCLTFLSSHNEKAFPTAKKVLTWTLENLYDHSEKDFYYAILKSRFTGRIYRSEIKYLRWSQAWMLRALSRYVLYSKTGKILI